LDLLQCLSLCGFGFGGWGWWSLALALALLPVVGWLAGCFALFFVGGVFYGVDFVALRIVKVLLKCV
jgi:hypothetical protein